MVGERPLLLFPNHADIPGQILRMEGGRYEIYENQWCAITDIEGSPTPKAKSTCTRISFRRFITCFQEALRGEEFRIGVNCGVMKHVPELVSVVLLSTCVIRSSPYVRKND